ncbi:MAG: hypothetical protein AAF703_21715 [Cyanobacteria bacterium P01_D01_bin.105]
MVVVFYCYHINIKHQQVMATEPFGRMYFPAVPQVGQLVKLRATGMLAEIASIDHYQMVIDVIPLPIADPAVESVEDTAATVAC